MFTEVMLSADRVKGHVMNAAARSVFELSPSEKLQLVEDLWDDLAADPESIPIHEWQKKELTRRNENLSNNLASGLTWEEVKRRVRARHGR
jgi:putative addiction module component (TIGR02574 family)